MAYETKLGQDKTGRFFRNLGGKKIYLGRDEAQARDRLGAVLRLYQSNCDQYGSQWETSNLAIARDIAKHGAKSKAFQVAESIENRKITNKLTGQNLFDALDWYLEERKKILIDDDGNVKQSYGTDYSQIESIKNIIPDTDLGLVDFDLINQWHIEIRSRPKSQKTKKKIAHKTAQNYLKKLREALREIHLSSKWNFKLPADFPFIKTAINGSADDPEPTHLSIDQLITINKYCNDFDRLLFYIGLNIAGGASEIGQLKLSEINLDKQITRGRRPKTNVKNSHYLFDTTTEEIKKYLAIRPDTDEETLLVTSTGKKTYRTSQRGNRTSVLVERWSRIQKRIQKDIPDWQFVPLNSLRDTMAQMVLEIDPYLSELVLSHQHPTGGKMNKHYTASDFSRLHDAQKQIEKKLKPVFDSAVDDIGKQVIGYEKKRKAFELLDIGVSKAETARQLGVNVATIYRWLESKS